MRARVEGSRLDGMACVELPLADPGRATVTLSVPETALASGDALIERVRRLKGAPDVSGRLGMEAKVRLLGAQPYVEGRVWLRDGAVRYKACEASGVAADIPFECGLSARTTGRPFFAFDRASAGRLRAERGRVEFQVTPDELFIDRAEVGVCKGTLQTYSVHLARRDPKADATVYADRIDLGEAVMLAMPFEGRMEGALYGRFPVSLENGKVRLATGYLYSLPGRGGTLRIENPAPVTALLERSGITGEVQAPLARALSDLDFSAIRMELEPKTEGDSVMRIQVEGKSNFKEWPAPVALGLNIHGPLEQLLNTGLKMSR
jgi:hypothetical protein